MSSDCTRQLRLFEDRIVISIFDVAKWTQQNYINHLSNFQKEDRLEWN
jgi:hypothetical protein